MQTSVDPQKRRRIHGGEAPTRYPVTVESANGRPPAPQRIRNWRTTLVGASLGLSLVLMLLLGWLMEHQVGIAAERRARETAARLATLRCLSNGSPREVETCLKLLEPGTSSGK